MRAELRLQDAGHGAHDSTTKGRRENEQWQTEERRDAGGKQHACNGRDKSSSRYLTLRADVEEAGAKSEAYSQPGEREGRGLVQHLTKAVRISPRSLEQEAIHGARGLSKGKDQHVADHGGEQQRHNGRQQRLLESATVHAACSAPVMN